MFKLYRVDICDVAIKMFEDKDLDEVKKFRSYLYFGDENARHDGEPIQNYRYVIIED